MYKTQVLNSIFDGIRNAKKCTKNLVLLVTTRWGLHLFCLQSMAVCKESLQTLAVKEEAGNILGLDKKQTLLDDEIFWVCTESTKALVEPVVNWILKLESNEDTIHLCFKAFSEIQESLAKNLPLSVLQKNEGKNFMDKYLERKSYALTSIHKASCLLDSKAQGCYLSSEEQLDAIEYIVSFARSSHFSDDTISPIIDHEQLLVEIANYRAHEGMWAKDFIWTASQNVTPVVWWKGIIGQNNQLSKVAVKILSVPATSASTERTFSTFSAVHTKKRNKLTTPRAIKLTYIAHYWRTRNKAKTAVWDVPLDKNECPSTSSLTQVTESVQHFNMIVPEAEIPGLSGFQNY
ncbi:unnamed protein product [Psylliodes chrysocephalus]|uniref:HAT C-terminal dimerisation domain-containing protein n=1 Tax=Psylliodes chrysocephalus TaxID=3402493 RepID=A0A9P0CXB2_9CUCU|nr:unnamed protein product [Psylliodes chrysocephala]